MTPEFLLDGLNEGQRAAVTAPPDKHYLVLAGAGCGKTTVLTRRIGYLTLCGIPLESVLALTFTRKAAQEMAARLTKLTNVQSSENQAVVTTFHAFALSLLHEDVGGAANFTRIGYSQIPHLATDKERLAMLAQVSTSNERSILGMDVLHLDSAIEKLAVFPLSGAEVESESTTLLKLIAHKLALLKKQNALWDFSDLIEGAITLFSLFPQILHHYCSRFAAILVDEFQDTNPQQIRLLNQLLGNNRVLYAVGDDDQAIYAFRGADIRPTLEFATYFPGAQILKLEINYRSTPAILQKANRLFAKKDPAYRKVLVSGVYKRGVGARPAVYRFTDQSEMGAWVLSRMKLLAQKEKIHLPDMAMLFRLNQSMFGFEQWLNEQSVPVAERPQLLTVHKSKGLEFPVVFIGDLEESLFPSYRQKKMDGIRSVKDFFRLLFGRMPGVSARDLEEELRLFYVAVTRAQKHFFLLSVQKRVFYGRTRRFNPSRFLRYMR